MLVSSVSSIFFLYVATVASVCFKSRLDVVHGMCVVGSGQRRRRRYGVAWATSGTARGPTIDALPREPDVLGAHSLHV
jgi:hypothetical protein